MVRGKTYSPQSDFHVLYPLNTVFRGLRRGRRKRSGKMHRRRFMQAVGGGLILRPTVQETQIDTKDEFLRALASANDEVVAALIERQLASGPLSGGLLDQYGIYSAGATSGFIQRLTAAFCSSDSSYYRREDLVARMERAAECLLRQQHSDGTIDLVTTNFHSPPDTAFVLEPVCVASAVLAKLDDSRLTRLKSLLEEFEVAGGGALVVGGIHTPNHRWVVCSALARVHSLYPNPAYVERIDTWLAEGIDIDSDGQYTERSSSIYSPTCDRVLMNVARLLNRPELLEPVRRNLEMTLYFLHSSGEVATEASRRQDRNVRATPLSYYLPARYLALRDRNPRFAAMTNLIEGFGPQSLSGNLIYFQEDPSLAEPLPVPEALPDDFYRFFAASDLIRIRRGRISATVLSDDSRFLSVHKGEAVLEAVRFASAFFGKGQFRGDKLQIAGETASMSQELTGPYYQPLQPDQRRKDGNWGDGDRSLRLQSEVQEMLSVVNIREANGVFTVEISVDRCDGVPFALELGFRPGGDLRGVTPVPGVEQAFFLKEGTGEYRVGADTIRFGPGHYAHSWTDLRGADPKLPGLSVYLTGLTPLTLSLTIS